MTFEQLTSFETLYGAYLSARKGKRKKYGTAQYEANALAGTEKLSRLLRNGTYHPSKFEIFTVYEPKERLIQAPAFVDKVVLHACVDNILYEAITKSFIRDNCASQKGKGTQDALSRLKHHMVGYYGRYRTAEGWVLKCDVHHFFASIDHDKLKALLRKLFAKRQLDVRVYDLLCVYIDASDGLPLGYQTSQLLALLFLDEFDHYIVEKRKFRYYGRYMDDFYVIAPTKKELQDLLVDVRAWMGRIGLELNSKTGIFPLRNGIDYLGFHTYLTETGAVVQKLRQDNIERIRSRVRYWSKAYPAGELTKEEIIDKFRAWDAFAAYGDTYELRLKYAKQVSAIIGTEVKPRRKINSTRSARAMRRMRQARNIYKKNHPAPAHAVTTPTGEDAPPWE